MLKKAILYQVLLIVFIILALFSILNFFSYQKERDQEALEIGRQKRDEVQILMDSAITSVERLSYDLAKKISEKNYSKLEVENLIKEYAHNYDFYSGITIAFEPEIVNDSVKVLYAPFYNKKTKELKYINKTYDYSNNSLERAEWFTEVKIKQTGVWSDPKPAQIGEELVVDFGVPFHTSNQGDNEFAGVISVTLESSFISNYLHSISLSKSGFAYIVNQNKLLIATPNTDYLTDPEIIKKGLKKKPSFIKIFNEKEGKVSSYSDYLMEETDAFFKELVNGWKIVLVVPKRDLIVNSSNFNHKLMYITALITISLILLLIILYRVWEGNTSNLWRFSLLISLLFLLNIIFLWYINHNSDYILKHTNQSKIVSRISIDNYLKERNTNLKKISTKLQSVEVPIGIFLYDIDFIDAYNVAVIGKIWQKIPDTLKNVQDINFVFPQAAAEGISVRVRPMLKKHVDDYWLYRYDFNATLQFDINYLNYPLNLKTLDLQITYPNFEDQVVFTPDIESYKFINPSSKPGISNDIYMPDSEVLSSYYSFGEHNFNTSLGDEYYEGLNETPVLTFNILIKNVIINAIISNIIPIFIIAIMVFLLPFTIDKKNGEIKEGGSLNIIQASAGFFFILLLAHIQLRNNLETPGITYIELYYFVMYFMLALMSAAVLLFLKTNKYPVLEYKHNLIFKISYWPLLLLSIYLITIFIFY